MFLFNLMLLSNNQCQKTTQTVNLLSKIVSIICKRCYSAWLLPRYEQFRLIAAHLCGAILRNQVGNEMVFLPLGVVQEAKKDEFIAAS